jgi:hypothetical protein
MLRLSHSRCALAAVLSGIAFNVPAQAELIYGVNASGFLISWDSASPRDIEAGVAVQGLQPNESIVGLDFRPADGALYGLGSFSRLYRIDPSNGQATQVGAGPFSPALSGGAFGFDFNPVVDLIRVVSNADQNLRLNPLTGAVAGVDTPLAYPGSGDPGSGFNPNVVSVAYTNSFAGASSTSLFGLDTGLDTLVRIDPPGAGVLSTIGPLGVNIIEIGGFDISGATSIAYVAAILADHSNSFLYTINLATGAMTPVGEIGGGNQIHAIAVVPEPGSLVLVGLGAAFAYGWRRRAV